MKLITMTELVLEQRKNYNGDFKDLADLYFRYAKFLKQPLELGMFLLCVDNNVFNYSMHGNKEQFEQAKERCLFEGFQFKDANEDNPMPFIYLNEDVTLYPEIWIKEDTIEALLYYNDFIELTQTAIKELGL